MRKSARASNRGRLAFSQPKARWETTPVPARTETPVRAKSLALAVAATAGSSRTASAPQARAHRVRINLSKMAGSPLWVKFPLIMTIV